MPELRFASRLLGAASVGLLSAALAGPAALAQTDPVPVPTADEPDDEDGQPPAGADPGPWDGSTFEAPFDEPDPALRRATFDVEGTLRYEKSRPTESIETVEVRVVGEPASSADGCALPEPVSFEGDGPRLDPTVEHHFLVEGVTIACNGRYAVEAEGRLADPDDPAPHTMRRTFTLAAPPASVTGLGVTVDGAERAVTATFRPPDALAPDAIGYVLERSGGPSGDSFVDVASIDPDAEPRFVDPLTDAPAGAYTYRIRAVRAGPDGEIRSSTADAESDTVEVEGDPPTATSTPPTSVRSGGASGRSSGARPSIPRSGTIPRLTTPTTLDTGFEERIDYGDEPEQEQEQELAGDDPLAGQSIVRDEAEDMGLAIPAAGALVMLGWAGHILYLNRLAKQL